MTGYNLDVTIPPWVAAFTIGLISGFAFDDFLGFTFILGPVLAFMATTALMWKMNGRVETKGGGEMTFANPNREGSEPAEQSDDRTGGSNDE